MSDTITNLMSSFDCDGLVVDATSDPDMVAVSPVRSSDGTIYEGMVLVTSLADVLASGVALFEREAPHA